MPKKTTPTSTEEKLEEILLHLRRLDKRDRLRTFGGFFKGLISLIPIIVLVWSLWYMYQYGDQLLEKISASAAKQAAIVTEQQKDSLINKFQNYLGQ
ncbi:MAG: hypothetical protein WCX61_01760 [Candidatus Peribacteraceae bacterium]|jgi:uncharacterized membrane protein